MKAERKHKFSKGIQRNRNKNIYESYLDGLDTVVDVFLLLK